MALTASIQQLISLFTFLKRAGVTAKYKTPSAMKELIVLSDGGKLLLEKMKIRLPDVEENDLYFGLFLDLYHKEFWIDTEQTDVITLVSLFDQMIFSGMFSIPWMFGRDLYDKYNRLFVCGKEELDKDETESLLDQTPVGVCQIGTMLIGPFGIISEALTSRPILPTTKLPLWHCADLGCEQLHEVKLSLFPIPQQTIAEEINDVAIELLGDGVDWDRRFHKELPYQRDYYNDNSINDIAAVLTSCLSIPELKSLTTQILIENSIVVRAKIKQRGHIKTLFSCAAAVTVSRLSKEQCLQLVLIMDDATIVSTLERLIHRREILIPAEEIRNPKLGGQGPQGWMAMYSELSQFGFRRVSNHVPDITIAISRLRSLIKDFYQKRELQEIHLGHALRFHIGNTVEQKLDNFLNNHDPRSVLKDLISIHDRGLIQCVEYLRFGYAPPLLTIQDKIAGHQLNGKKIGGEKLTFKADGKNTLFPLVVSFSVLAKHIANLRKRSAKKYVRPPSQRPGYSGTTLLEEFPFNHTLYLFDISDEDFNTCLQSLEQVSSLLSDGKICEIRNRLEHGRPDFPSREEVETCCDAVSESIKKLVSSGLCPVDYYRSCSTKDSYGRAHTEYIDYLGNKIVLKTPSHFLSYQGADAGPIAICRSVHIGSSSDYFFARLESASEYAEMWRNYPMRWDEERADLEDVVGSAVERQLS